MAAAPRLVGDTACMALPEVAVGLILSEDGRLLLQHRDDKPGIINPGRWGGFGGHLDPCGRAARGARLRPGDGGGAALAAVALPAIPPAGGRQRRLAPDVEHVRGAPRCASG